jgi:hypothetical protein
MAEIKKEAPKEDKDWIITLFPLILIFVIIIVGSHISGYTIFGEKVENQQRGILAGKKNIFDIYEWIGTEQVVRGSRIINTRNVTVRNEPGGTIVGAQKKLETGIVRNEPISAFDVVWLRVDYKKAPDGWILAETASTKINAVRGVNIFPIVYNFYKPIGYIALFVLLFVFIYFKLKLKAEEAITEKKLALKLDAAREKPLSVATRIEQKPDAQEIPGFQTEEIMPIEQLEKESRWTHIQDLIKSYNENDWRQAIIEADIILEEMLDKMQYDGVTIGDKLKNVERSDFVTLDKAWSAHKVRNQIAHDGSNFKVTRDIAEKTIKDFEEVFKEFYYI